jgi:hypothetical protein
MPYYSPYERDENDTHNCKKINWLAWSIVWFVLIIIFA